MNINETAMTLEMTLVTLAQVQRIKRVTLTGPRFQRGADNNIEWGVPIYYLATFLMKM